MRKRTQGVMRSGLAQAPLRLEDGVWRSQGSFKARQEAQIRKGGGRSVPAGPLCLERSWSLTLA